MKRKVLAGILSLVMTVSLLAGCGNSAANNTDAPAEKDSAKVEESKEEGESSGGKYKIGYNYFGSSAYSLMTLANNSQIVIDAFGNEAVAMDDEYSVEKIVQDVENMISSGIDGLIVWLPTDSLYQTVASLCEEAQIPFVLNDKVPTDPAVAESIKSNPYFAGAVAPANAEYGALIAEYALEQGWKECIVSSSFVGDASDQPRLDAFKEKFEDGGGKILQELHADTSDQYLPQIEDALVATGEVDFIYGVGSDMGAAACVALEKYDYKTKVVTSGLDKEVLDLLEQGTMVMINGDNWISGMFSAVVLQNYLEGNKLVDADGNVAWIDNIMPFTVPDTQFDLYREYFIDNNCYSEDEILQMSGSEFDYDALMEVIEDYSLENRLLAKYEEGSISEEQLKEAGIEVK